MKKLKAEIRMYLAELILGLAIRIAPRTVDGDKLVLMIKAYFNSAVLKTLSQQTWPNKDEFKPNVDTKAVEKKIHDTGEFIITVKKNIMYGVQLRTNRGNIINVFTSGRITLQGEPSKKLQQLFQ